MKHLIIGDLHGRDTWEQADVAKYDKVVFLGDYVDSMYRPNFIIADNFKNVIAFKKKYPEKAVLLLGNHDVQYLHYPNHYCPGFRPTMQAELTSLFHANKMLFQIAYQRRNFIFSHAGITNKWFRALRQSLSYRLFYRAGDTIADTINRIERETHNSIIYNLCRYCTDEDSDGGPLWADLCDTWDDSLNGYHQFVGHTPQDKPAARLAKGKSITYLDVLHKQVYFHEVNID